MDEKEQENSSDSSVSEPTIGLGFGFGSEVAPGYWDVSILGAHSGQSSTSGFHQIVITMAYEGLNHASRPSARCHSAATYGERSWLNLISCD